MKQCEQFESGENERSNEFVDIFSNGGLLSDTFLDKNTAGAAPSTWKKEGSRGTDALLTLFGRGELCSKPRGEIPRINKTAYLRIYSIERHLRWTLEGHREEKKYERKEKRPWQKNRSLVPCAVPNNA